MCIFLSLILALIDMILKSQDDMINSPEALYLTQVTTLNAGLVPISELSELKHTTSITKIRHVDGKRTITLQVTPPTTMTSAILQHRSWHSREVSCRPLAPLNKSQAKMNKSMSG